MSGRSTETKKKQKKTEEEAASPSASDGEEPPNKRSRGRNEEEEEEDDTWFDGVDDMIASDPSQLHFQIFNYCRQNGGFFQMKKDSPFDKAFAVFESETGQTRGSYRYRYAGQWIDRNKSPSDYSATIDNKIIVEAWPRGALVPQYCRKCCEK